MSAVVEAAIVNPDSHNASNEALGQGQPARSASQKNYKGFVAGVFSGIAKLSGRIKQFTSESSPTFNILMNILDQWVIRRWSMFFSREIKRSYS